jgi:hypothetical protein
MAKQRKKPKPAEPVVAAHPPAKRPMLLAVSVVLFLAWFVFLLVAALRVI